MFFANFILMVVIVFFLTLAFLFVSYHIKNRHKHVMVEYDRWDNIVDGRSTGYTILYRCRTCTKTHQTKVEYDK